MPHLQLGSANQYLKLYYELHGSGENKILFIMGLWTDGEAWCRQTEYFKLKTNYQSVTYDNRGCGRSSAPFTIHYTTEQMAKDALALADHLKWDQFHVVGVSMGGMIALELGLLASKRVLSLSLLATHAGGIESRAPLIGVQQILRSLTLRDERVIVENVMQMLYSRKTLANPERNQMLFNYHIERVRKRIPPALIGIFGHLAAVCRHHLSYAELLRLRYSPFPALIFVGTEDRLVREANSYLIRKTLGCRLIKLHDTGHGLQGERSDEINRELFDFFELTARKYRRTKIDEDFSTEINAVELCCQHRTPCFFHDLLGFLKVFCLGVIIKILLPLIGFHLTSTQVFLFALINGIRQSFICSLNAFRARSFVRQHGLQLNRAAHHGGVSIKLDEEDKKGIPHDCGFEFPILPMIFFVNSIALIYWIGTSK